VHFTRFRLELFSPHAPERKSLSLSTSENALGSLATSLVFAASRKKTAEPLSIILGTHLPLRAASSRRRVWFDGIIELALIAAHMLLPEECVRISLAHSCGNYKIRYLSYWTPRANRNCFLRGFLRCIILFNFKRWK